MFRPSLAGRGGDAYNVEVAVGGRQEVLEHGHGVREVVQDPTHFPGDPRRHVKLSSLLRATLQCHYWLQRFGLIQRSRPGI
jgi:hypothetical protein